MRALAAHAARDAVECAVKIHIFGGGEIVVDTGILKSDAEAFADFLGLAGGVETVDPDRAAGRAEDRGEHFDGGGFSRAVGPEEGEDLPRLHLERDGVNGAE